jgi:hypothetical protein
MKTKAEQQQGSETDSAQNDRAFSLSHPSASTIDTVSDGQRRAIVSAFLDRLNEDKGLKPATSPFPYDCVPEIKTARWPPFLGALMVEDELRELTNQLNHWWGNLRRWYTWNEVLKSQDADARWETEWGWVEPLAFYCMFQPSATRDRFIMVATHALHQVRIAIDPTTIDTLLGDPKPPDQGQFFPSRRDREKQLKGFAKPWPTGKPFIQALCQLDDHSYRALTGDFRNRASHGIPPRLSVGFTSMITRTRQQATKLEPQPDGTYRDAPVPGKLTTSYSLGGTPPLSMQDAQKANLAQFEQARRTFDAYVALLTEAVAAMPSHNNDLSRPHACW